MSAFDQAFEITEDDILVVLMNMGLPHEDEDVRKWEDLLDMGEAIGAALQADDLDEQAQGAHDNLRDQILNLTEGERTARARHEKTMSQVPQPSGSSSRRRATP